MVIPWYKHVVFTQSVRLNNLNLLVHEKLHYLYFFSQSGAAKNWTISSRHNKFFSIFNWLFIILRTCTNRPFSSKNFQLKRVHFANKVNKRKNKTKKANPETKIWHEHVLTLLGSNPSRTREGGRFLPAGHNSQ